MLQSAKCASAFILECDKEKNVGLVAPLAEKHWFKVNMWQSGEAQRQEEQSQGRLCLVFTAMASLIPCSASLLSRVVLPPGLQPLPI